MSQNTLNTLVPEESAHCTTFVDMSPEVATRPSLTIDTSTRAPQGPRPNSSGAISRRKKKKTPRAHSVPAKPKTPSKKDLWFLENKIREMELKQQAVKKPAIHDAYRQKLAKLAKTREKELVGKCFRRWKKDDQLKMQSGIEGAFFSICETITDPKVRDLAEDLLFLTYDLVRSSTVMDYIVSTMNFMKKRISDGTLKALRGLLVKFVTNVISDTDFPQMQGGAEKLETARNTLKMWPRFKSSPLWRKVNCVVIYATSLTLFGNQTTTKKTLKIEDQFYKSRSMAQADFAYNVLDLLLFVAERGIQVIQSKKIDPMFHSGGAYEKWYEEASDVISKANFLANPKAHGIDIHTFTASLDDLIQKGQSMYKYSCELDKVAKGIIRGTVDRLLMVRASYLNRKVAQQTRRSPLALVLEGHSSVAKTTFANLLHYFYGTYQGKNVDAGARYTRMSASDFWDGFSSDQWSLLIDDAGSIKPSVLQGIDPSIREILLAVNNAPFVPDMAKLEDKGAAPFLCELVVITTNSPELNYNHCFNCPGAAARRTPFHIRIRPKSHLKKNATMIDETKLPILEPGSYPDWWDIEILEPRLAAMSDDASYEFQQTFSLETVAKFSNMKQFLTWYKTVIDRHTLTQDKMASSEEAFRATKLCVACCMPTGMCDCPGLQEPDISLADVLEGLTAGGPVDEEDGNPLEPPEFAMQGGWEIGRGIFNSTTMPPSPPINQLEKDYWGEVLINFIVAGLNWFIFGSTKIAATVICIVMMNVIYQARYLFYRMFTTPNWNISWYITSIMMNRAYYAMADHISDRLTAVSYEIGVYSHNAADAMRICGERVANTFFVKTKLVKLIILALTIIVSGYFAHKLFTPKMEMQGSVLSSLGRSPEPGTESANVWVHGMYTPSLLDLGRHTISWKNMDDANIQEILGRNCAFIRYRTADHWKIARCFGIGGQYFVTTYHSIPKFEDRIDCQLVRSNKITGPTGNVNFRLCRSDMKIDEAKDICIFRCSSVPPMRNVTDLFVRERLTQFRANGYYINRSTTGEIEFNPVTGIHEEKYYNSQLQTTNQVWWGKAATATTDGYCGSILVAKSGSGPVILGIHQLGSKNKTVGAVKVTYEDIMYLMDGALIVNDAPPMLDTPSTSVGEPGPIHPKSPLNFLEEGTVECFGSFDGFRSDTKFNVEPTIMAPYLETKGYKIEHCAPQVKGWKPKYDGLKDFVVVDSGVDDDIVAQAADGFLEDLKKVDPKWKKEIMIYDIHTAVNGVPGLKYVDGVKRSTSAGFPYNKPKQMLLEQLAPTADYPDHVQFVPEVEDRIEKMCVDYLNDSRAGSVFKAAIKNEPLPIEKAMNGKARIFMIATVEMTVVMRMFLLSFVRVAQSNHFVFECAPGIESQSVEWDFLYQYLTQHGVDRTIFGDFKHYDRSMHPAFVLYAFEVIARFVEWASGDKKHANAIRCIGYDIAFAYVDYFGDLIRLFGKNPSGQALTAIINGIVQSLYMRFVFIHCSPKRSCIDFKLYVALMTYGDDSGTGVSKLAPFFNHTSIRDVLAKIGVIYTMADKESESKAYVNIGDGSFLKRAFLYCEETCTYVGPLEEASISKMLMVRIPSKVVSAEVQAVDAVRSANSEYFWHSRDIFEEKHAMFQVLLDHLGLRDLMVPELEDWKTLHNRYVKASNDFLARTTIPPFVNIEEYRLMEIQAGEEPLASCGCGTVCRLAQYVDDETVRTCMECGFLTWDDIELECPHCGQYDSCTSCGCPAAGRTMYNFLDGYWCESCKYDFVVGAWERGFALGYGAMSTILENQSTRSSVTPPTTLVTGNVEHAASVVAEAPAPRPTTDVLSEHKSDNHDDLRAENVRVNESSTNNTEEHFHLQSGTESELNLSTGADVMVSSSSAAAEVVQTTSFVDSGRGDTLTFAKPQNNLFTYDEQSNVDLGNFLKRPTLIKTITWTPGVLPGTAFDPWSLFLSTSEIKYKLNNFAYLRGNLKVKVVVNAAPFYYGALLLYYTPLPLHLLPGLGSVAGVEIQYSQRPHIWIFPQNNEGGEITLPFYFHKNFVDITSAAEVATLGTLRFNQFTNLVSANGASSNGVQLQIYAWMEDVSLFGPTTKLALQGGDEYGNGPVSAPATAIAHWATYLSRVPYIGRFAKATSIGASAVGKMAGLFGWTNVPVIDNVMPLKNVPFHDMASAHISEPTTKFLLDPKGELSVDPALVGLPSEDELSIPYLVGKESYLATGTWTAGAAAGAHIFSTKVTPALAYRSTISSGGTYSVFMTPMAWVGNCFGNWRGDIIFRFKVVCSKFHSGRLRIHWDPVASLSATTDYSHITYTTIIDLQESDEAEFRVPYMQALPWLGLDAGPAYSNNWSTAAAVTPTSTANGTLTVRVLNNLSAPTDSAYCNVLVFVRGADNLEFANPKDLPKGSSLLYMQSGTEPFQSNTPFNERYLLNWGEAIPSVRLLLRRSSLVDRITSPALTTSDEAGVLRVYQTRMPPTPGYDTNAYTAAKGVEVPATTFKFSYTQMTPLAWIAGGFVSMRGSVRWHYNVVNPDGATANNITVYRRVGGGFLSGNQGLEMAYISGAASTATSQSLIKGNMWKNYAEVCGQSGMALTNPITQTGVSVEYPMMTNGLYQYANPYNWLLGYNIDGSDKDTYQVEVDVHPAAGSGFNRLQLHRYVAAGTDFTLHYFLNTPVAYYNAAMGNVPV